jgi:hypothetical protein
MKTANHQRTIAPTATTGRPGQKPQENWSVLRDIPASGEQRDNFEKQLSALALANRTKDAWLTAQSQRLREPMSSMASMLDLIELANHLAIVRPLNQMPSEFDESAFKHLRRNFQQLVAFFNELADLTGETRLNVVDEELALATNWTQPLPVLESKRV